ncbi:hypothetical protein CRI77_22005 [Mycolicibacterium duvalii]|nr:hypothetical protein [Mycolicibacterium duvalii]PEG36889.1 hypothetical protein CRI77_22005 [Mycolicibacterium duvalii]
MLPGAGPALAQPEAGPAEISLGWRDLGLAPDMLLGTNTATEFTVPVPAGLNAVRLRGVMRAPTNIGAGFLEVSDRSGRLLAAVDLPAMAAAQAAVPLDIDVAAAQVQDSSIGLSFTVRPTDRADQICGPVQQLAISELSMLYVGADPPPTTVANFFPPVLEQVAVYAPVDADAAEQQAVLALTSTLSRRYQPIPLEVRVATLPRGALPPPAAPLERAVVVERGQAGLRVDNPGGPEAFLRISGRGDELTAQTSLLDTGLQSLAQVTAARVDQPGARDDAVGDTVAFAQLGIQARADVLRSASFNAGVDRAALGSGRIESLRVHLLADYTPVAPKDSATVTVRSGDEVVYTGMLDESGRLDTTFELAGAALPQRVGLDFTVTYTPGQECGPFVAPLSFQVDPESTLTVRRGGGPLHGFGAFPSEFAGDFYVGLDGSGPNQLVHAAAVVAALARLTTAELTPKVVDFRSAVDSESGALLVANSAALEQTPLNPPLSGNGSSVSADLPGALRAEVDNGLGSIQAFADPARDRSVVLVTTTGAWTLVDPLFGYLAGLDGGWSALSGDVLAAGTAGVPTDLSIRGADAPVDDETAGESRVPWLWIALAVLVVAAVATLGLWAWSRRRSTDRDA